MLDIAKISVRTGSSFETVCPFPIGFIYMSSVEDSPASLFGGTWTQLSDDRFWMCSNNFGTLGGEATHQLTVKEMPSHTHYTSAWVLYDRGSWWTPDDGRAYPANMNVTSMTPYKNDGIKSTNTGGGSAHNNTPLYRTCFCWYRTA